MLQDSLKYNSQNINQPDSLHKIMPVLLPLTQPLPDSIQQGIPPYANPHTTPTDSIFSKLELNQFFWTLNQQQDKALFKGKIVRTEKSIFTGSEIKAVDLKPRLINDNTFSWLTGILILSFIFYTITQFLYAKRLKQIINATFARRYVNQLVREGGIFRERVTIGLLFIYFSTATITIFQGLRFVLKLDLIYPELTFCAIFLGLFAFWFLKVVIIKFLGNVFKTHDSAYEYNITSLINCEFIGLILLPLSFPIVYQNSELFSKIGLVIILAGLAINFIRGFIVGINNTKFSLFYLILYLCTLEILPLVVVAKIFINH